MGFVATLAKMVMMMVKHHAYHQLCGEFTWPRKAKVFRGSMRNQDKSKHLTRPFGQRINLSPPSNFTSTLTSSVFVSLTVVWNQATLRRWLKNQMSRVFYIAFARS